MALLEEDKAQRTLQAQQQADSVRYLNELNSVRLPPSDYLTYPLIVV